MWPKVTLCWTWSLISKGKLDSELFVVVKNAVVFISII